nr:MAG TPA: hypothetical protein [Caudoviricetes sp.]
MKYPVTPVLLQHTKKNASRISREALIYLWCGRWDLNPYELTFTTPSK